MLVHALMRKRVMPIPEIVRLYELAKEVGFIRAHKRTSKTRNIRQRVQVFVCMLSSKSGYMVWRQTHVYMLDEADRERVLRELSR